MSAIATRLASTKSPVRLKVIDKGTTVGASKAFSSGEVDLAVVRSDLGDLSSARTVVLVTHGVVMIVVPPGRDLDDMAELKGKTVGEAVVAGGLMSYNTNRTEFSRQVGRYVAQIFNGAKPADLPAAQSSSFHFVLNLKTANAAMESFFSSLKTERTARKMYRTRDAARADVFDYIERFYNPKRRHSTIGYMSPMEFERQAGLA